MRDQELKSAAQQVLISDSLPDVREDEATGDIAAIYADIRAVQNLSTVNYIWRHLATINGALEWAWTTTKGFAPAISLKAADLSTHASTLVNPWTIETSAIQGNSRDVAAVVQFYNRGNAWNLSALSYLLGVVEPPKASTPSLPVNEASIEPIPKLPRFADLSSSLQALVHQLAACGPGADTGIRPSLWVHLALWPEHLTALSSPVKAMISSEDFREAHRRLLTICGAEHVPPINSTGVEARARASLEKFHRRIAEMLLIGHALTPSGR